RGRAPVGPELPRRAARPARCGLNRPRTERGGGFIENRRREPRRGPRDQRSIRRQPMSDDSGPSEGVKGVVEGLKGKAKEAVGAVTGQDDMAREGRAQQDKAEDQREVAEK